MLSNINVNVTYLTEMTFLSPVCHILYGYDKCCLMFVPSLSHLTSVMTNFVQFCPQFVTSHPCYDKFCPIFVPVCHIFWIFIHFLCIKCIFWHFVLFLSHFLAHVTNFVTFPTPQKPSNTKGFRDWSKICHIFPNFVPSLSRVCHVHKPRGYAVYT